jgi:Uma2 family endonuclease
MTLSLNKSQRLTPSQERRDAAWSDYRQARDTLDWNKIAFDRGWLWIQMGAEGPEHARFSDLLTIIFGFWAFLHPEQTFESLGRCLIEHSETQACSPDLVLYQGEAIPRWQPGEPRRIELSRHRPPDLVGEIADTTLSLDLDEQKRLYASLGIQEYWVIDVKAARLFVFGLTSAGIYNTVNISQVLSGFPLLLLEQALERLATETNTATANWFMQQLQTPGAG